MTAAGGDEDGGSGGPAGREVGGDGGIVDVGDVVDAGAGGVDGFGLGSAGFRAGGTFFPKGDGRGGPGSGTVEDKKGAEQGGGAEEGGAGRWFHGSCDRRRGNRREKCRWLESRTQRRRSFRQPHGKNWGSVCSFNGVDGREFQDDTESKAVSGGAVSGGFCFGAEAGGVPQAGGPRGGAGREVDDEVAAQCHHAFRGGLLGPFQDVIAKATDAGELAQAGVGTGGVNRPGRRAIAGDLIGRAASSEGRAAEFIGGIEAGGLSPFPDGQEGGKWRGRRSDRRRIRVP